MKSSTCQTPAVSAPSGVMARGKARTPTTFLNSVERHFLVCPTINEAAKVCLFELWLKAGSAAELWFSKLKPEDKDNWEHLSAAFNLRWPARILTVMTTEEKHALLMATVISEDSLGKRVKVGGVEEFSHIIWADKIGCLVKAIKDENGLLIPVVRCDMPRVLKLLVGTQHTIWPMFCTAVHAVSVTELLEHLEVEHEQRAIQEQVACLQALQQCHTHHP
ncbi:hypothetical protein BDZ97DRAFT_1920720 [Flammula alnicola]|nr:hypothetical protein BDZ97DRAFT_1920720 [Flammula alnicola]